MKPQTRSEPRVKVSLPLMSHPDQSSRSSPLSDWKTMRKTEGDTEKCCSPLPALKNTSQESSSRRKLPNNPPRTECSSSNTSRPRELFRELKLIKDWVNLPMERGKTLPRDLRPYPPWLVNFTNWVADSLSGELCLKLVTDAPLILLFSRMLKDWPNMHRSARKMDLFPLSNLKFFLTALTQWRTARELLKRY